MIFCKRRKAYFLRLLRERAAVQAARKLRKQQSATLLALGSNALIPAAGVPSRHFYRR